MKFVTKKCGCDGCCEEPLPTHFSQCSKKAAKIIKCEVTHIGDAEDPGLEFPLPLVNHKAAFFQTIVNTLIGHAL